MFWNKKPPEQVEVSFSQRLLRIESRLTLLEADILDLGTAQEIIRNKVLRKIQGKKAPEDEDKPKDLYGGMFLSEK